MPTLYIDDKSLVALVTEHPIPGVTLVDTLCGRGELVQIYLYDVIERHTCGVTLVSRSAVTLRVTCLSFCSPHAALHFIQHWDENIKAL